MAISEAARNDLYTGFCEVFGIERAETLMSVIPLHDLDEVATKGDISELREATRADIAELRAELKGDISELREATRADIAELRTELKDEISGLRGEVKGDIAGLRDEMKDAIGHLRASMHAWMTTLLLALIVAMVGIGVMT